MAEHARRDRERPGVSPGSGEWRGVGLRASHAETSYGAHQEAAAANLNQLLIDAPSPTDPDQTAQLLACREAVLDAWRDRLHQLGSEPHARYCGAGKDLIAAVRMRRPGWVLHRVLDNLTRLPTDPHPGAGPVTGSAGQGSAWSPIEALGSPCSHPTVELWRGAAVELTAGNHALLTAQDRPWLVETSGAWHLLGDTATGVEALAVLDVRLTTDGLLRGHRRPSSQLRAAATWSVAEQRAATSQVARVASWYAEASAVDLAKPATLARPITPGAPQPVREPADLAAAQRQLALFIQAPGRGESWSNQFRRTMDARTLLALIRSQHQVCASARDHFVAEAPGEAGDLAQVFEGQRSIYAQLLPHAQQLVDAEGVRGVNEPALAQQRELLTGTRRNTGRWTLSHSEGADLATATHAVLHELAVAARHELARDAGTLRVKDPLGARPPSVGSHHSSLYLAFRSATRLPAPISETPHWTPLTSRRALSTTLARTPTGKRPNPYPPRRPDPAKNREHHQL